MFQVEATGCVKTLKKEPEEPSKVGALGFGAREVHNEAGVGSGRALSLMENVGRPSAAWH